MSANKQRLVMLFDGTWNDPQKFTNVYRIAANIEDFDGDVRQRFFYGPGVGTSRFTKIRGGVFGVGLKGNLMQGYDWLARNYRSGDEIYMFGFSRGAYTARSLAGMIGKCGLLRVTTPDLLMEAEKIYRNKKIKPEHETCRIFRERYTCGVKIHLIGVWDTVGALGVPGTMISERGLYSWHDTRLSEIVERAYHAVALDEHRAVYDSVLWTDEGGVKKPENLDVEQRWFIGAHANVGGGYTEGSREDPLADIPLVWMQEKAMAAGLKIVPCVPKPDAHKAEATDSFEKFLKGAYRAYRKRFHPDDGRHHRRYDKDADENPAVGVTVDPSVWARWREISEYRPKTLTDAGLGPPD